MQKVQSRMYVAVMEFEFLIAMIFGVHMTHSLSVPPSPSLSLSLSLSLPLPLPLFQSSRCLWLSLPLRESLSNPSPLTLRAAIVSVVVVMS